MGSGVFAATVSSLNEMAFAAVEAWLNRPLEHAFPYVYVDGIYLKRFWGGSLKNVAVMVAIEVSDDGYCKVAGSWSSDTQATVSRSRSCWVSQEASGASASEPEKLA